MSLDDLGWDPRWADAAAAVPRTDDAPELIPARVVIEHRGAYEVSDGAQVLWAELSGRTYRDARDRRALPAVGDWILIDAAPDGRSGSAVIRHLLPRRSLVVRRAAGEKTAPQPIAANIDVGFIVTSANADLSARRLERYLVLLREGGVRPVIVLSKTDLVADTAPILAAIAVAAPGVAIASTSATGDGRADELRAHLGRGVTGVLMGSSGVGKSTLLNLLIGRDAAVTRPIREHDARGKHTTTRRELFTLPDGSVLVDTPGMRELALWAEDDDAVDFADIEALAAGCRFADCRHQDEPGCAVAAAAASGALEPARLAGFRKLSAELASGERRRDDAARADDRRRTKVVTRSLRSRLKDKGRTE